MLAARQVKSLDLTFEALADGTRRAMLDRLRDGPLTVTELAQPFAMSLNGVSKHIKKLERAGLIRRRIAGREHFCALDARNMEDATRWISHYAEFWSDRLDSLDKFMSAKKRRGSK